MKKALIGLLGTLSLYGAEHFETLEVQGTQTPIEDHIIHDTSTLARDAVDETLGGYLENEALVSSATYGNGVGRPVVKGMEGYRVGIVQGNTVLNDLSAMSQDHAVGANARSSQTIELIKGPASLLYGSYAGGVVSIKGPEHDTALPQAGLDVQAFGSVSSNDNATQTGARAAYRYGDVSVDLSTLFAQSQNYFSGAQEIPHSHTQSTQSHLVLGWQAGDRHVFKAYGDILRNDYGIPNSTALATRIDMRQERVGLVWHVNHPSQTIEHISTDIQYSRYKHYETEDASPDGLFGQQQAVISTLVGFDVGAWHVDTHTTLSFNRLQVCHEHGGCVDFQEATRVGVASLLADSKDFSHTHPMPNSDETLLAQSVVGKYYLQGHELTLATRLAYRALHIDPSNIQESYLATYDPHYYDASHDASGALSLGWLGHVSDAVWMQASLGYIERMPSAQELFWNGYHHATDSYIFGDRHAQNERSFNIDTELTWEQGSFTTRLNGFYYRFMNYLYQRPYIDETLTWVKDPWHSSDVWEIAGARAHVYGASIEEAFHTEQGAHVFDTALSFEMLRGVLDNGENLPRMAPFSATIAQHYSYKTLEAKISYKQTQESSFLAPNESFTPSYGWLALKINYEKKWRMQVWNFYLNGQNLTDERAYNHLSFLKSTAPLRGRNITAGITWKF